MRNASSAVDVKPHHPKLQHVLGWYSICFGLLVHEIGMIMIMFPHCFQWFIISPQRNGHLGSYLHVQTDHDRPRCMMHFLSFSQVQIPMWNLDSGLGIDWWPKVCGALLFLGLSVCDFSVQDTSERTEMNDILNVARGLWLKIGIYSNPRFTWRKQ